MKAAKPIVFVCSPLTRAELAEDTAYASAATRDSLLRGEAPVCPQLLYPAVLDDTAEHRVLGMVAGLALLSGCDIFALYVDRGIGRGMRSLLDQARGLGLSIERRQLGGLEVATAVTEPTQAPDAGPVRKNTIDLG